MSKADDNNKRPLESPEHDTERKKILKPNENMDSNNTSAPKESTNATIAVGELDTKDLKMIECFRGVLREELDTRFSTFSKDEFLPLKANVDDMKSNMEKLKTEVDALSTQNAKLLEQNDLQQKQIDDSLRRMRYQEQNSRARNLIFKDLVSSSNLFDTIQNILQVKFELTNTHLSRVIKLREHGGKTTALAEFTSAQIVGEIVRNAAKLKGSGVYIDKDLSPEQRTRKSTLLKIRKHILQQSSGSKISVFENKIKIDDNKFNYESESNDYQSSDGISLRAFLKNKFNVEVDVDYNISESSAHP